MLIDEPGVVFVYYQPFVPHSENMCKTIGYMNINVTKEAKFLKGQRIAKMT